MLLAERKRGGVDGATCLLETICGDGVRVPSVEQCDDGRKLKRGTQVLALGLENRGRALKCRVEEDFRCLIDRRRSEPGSSSYM
jgi:hypothetical protein